MASETSRRRSKPTGAPVRVVLSGIGLLAIGVSAGVVIGSLVEGPRLFVRRLLEPTERVEIRQTLAAGEAEELTAFRELQSETLTTRRMAPSEMPQVAAAPQADLPSEPAASAVAEGKVAAEAKAEAQRESSDTASRLIAQMRAGRGASAPQAKAAAGQRVVQVAAYTDGQAAEALARRLSVQGFAAYVSPIQPEGSYERFRVRVRAESGQDVQILAKRLEKEGLSVWITRE